MNSPTTAIAWELWSRNRWATATVALAIPFLVIFNSSWLGEWFRIVEVLLFFFSMTTLVWTFCCVEPDARGKHGGFPPRAFTLPLSTIVLVAVPMLGGALALAAVYWLWTQLIFTVWDVAVPAALLRLQLLAITAMLFALQAIVWSLYRFPLIRIVLILAAMIGIGMLGLAAPGKNFRNMSEPAVLGTLGVITALAFAAAVAGVSRDRRGEWEGWTQRVIDGALAMLPHRRKPFSSGHGAQVWFEWRGKAFFLSAMLALPTAGMMMFYPIPTGLLFDPMMTASAYANLPILTLFMAWCLGMTLAKTDYWARETELSPFVTARPLTNGDIVVAKLKTAALIIMTAGAIFAALAVPVFNVPHWLSDADVNFPSWSQFKSQNPQLLLNISHPLVLLTAFAVTWGTMIEGLAIGLRGKKNIVIQLVVRVSLFISAVSLISLLAKRPGGLRLVVTILPWASALLIMCKVATTVLWLKRTQSLYSAKQRICLAALWLLVIGCIAGTAALVWTDISMFDRAIVFISAFLAPGSALFRAAASLHHNRHR